MFCWRSTVPGGWNPFPFLAWDLSMHPRTHIWFLTNLCALEHVHVVQIWIIHIKCIKNSVNAYKCPNEPRKITKNHTTLPLSHVDTRKKFESNKRQWISFRPQRWDVPYRKPSCLLWEAYTQTCPIWDKICTTACWWRSMIACQVSWILDKFWIY